MKTRLILFAIAALAASACTREAAQVESVAEKIVLTATQEGYDGTKSLLIDGGTQVFWEYGDNIKVFYDGKSNQFDSQITELDTYEPVTTFIGTLDNVSVGSINSTGKKILALYPYRDDATSDGNTITTALPEEQIGAPGSFFKRTQITAACSSSVALRFYNVTGGIRFKLSKSGIKKIRLEATNGENLAGKARITFNGAVPAIGSVTNGSSSVTLTAPRGESFSTGTWYYIVTLPATLSGGFRMVFSKDSESGIYTHSSSVTISRGKFGSLENPDKNVSFSEETTFSLLPEIHDGDDVLANNPLVEKFLTEVTYPERDYSYTKLFNYPPVAPGQSDVPPVYAIRWTADASAGELTATLTDGGWSKENTLPAGASCYTVTNLRPGASYTYQIKAKNGQTMASGSFTTHGHLHQLFFQKNVRNCRDLGGWKTKDGRTVKYRKVYRGGRLQWATKEAATLTEEGLAEVLAEGIKAQLELRNTNDAITETALGSGYAFCAPIIREGYTDMLRPSDGLTGKTRQCFEFIVNCVREDKPVYFHCSLGRDRTGTVAMLVLGVLGVNEGDISKEYELTQFAPHYWGTSEKEHTLFTRTANYAYKSAAGYIWDNFTTGSESFATGVEKFFLSIGVSQKDIDDFRNLMLE